MDETTKLTRRKFASMSTAALAAAGLLPIANAQQNAAPQAKSPREQSEERKVPRSPDHHLPNEEEPGPKNSALDAENPSSVWALDTDNGTVKPF